MLCALATAKAAKMGGTVRIACLFDPTQHWRY
jgi:hypothetical protein